MAVPDPGITLLVRRWSDGDESALHELIEEVYPQLRALARAQLRKSSGGGLSTTVLVNEAYLRIASATGGEWPSRAHFFAFCAKVMRHVLVDLARRRAADRRGGREVHVTLFEGAVGVEQHALEFLVVEEALRKIEARSKRMATVVECRLFGGLTVQETAEVLGTSVRTVEREWTRARAYLQHELGQA